MSKKVEIKVTTRGVGKVNRAIASIGTRFDKLKRDVKSAGASLMTFKNAAVVAGAGIALKKAFDFVEMGASIKKQRAAFESLAKSHGSSADKIIDNLKRISRGTVDTVSLMQSANKALLLGIDPGQFTKLMEIARAASKATGDTVTKSFEDITVGIGRQSKLILDNLGIIVKVGDANARYAAKLGKAVSALTDAEKKQAFLNATVEAGQAIIDGVGKDTDSTSDAIDRFKVSVKEAADELRELASSGLTGAIEAVEELNEKLKTTSEMAEKIPVERFGLLAAAARGGKLPGDVPGTPAYELKMAKEAARQAQNYAAFVKKGQIKGVAVPSAGKFDAASAVANEKAKEAAALKKKKIEDEKAHNRLLKTGASLTKTLLTPQEKLNEALKKYNELRAAGAISVETYHRAVKSATEDFKAATKASSQIGIAGTQSLTKMQEAMQDVSRSMKGELADLLYQGQFTFESFRKSAVSMVNIIRRKLAEKTADDIFSFFSKKGASKQNQAVQQFAQNFNRKTKKMFDTFISDKREMDVQFEDNLRGLGNIVGDTANNMRVNMENGFFRPTGNAFTRLADRARESIASMAESAGGLHGIVPGDNKGEEPGTFSRVVTAAAKILPYILHEGGTVAGAPRMKIPSFASGGEVMAKLHKNEFVVSGRGVRAAGIPALNRINRGDMSDFGRGRGGGGDVSIMAPVVFNVNTIDTQTGIEFMLQPHIAKTVEDNIEKAIGDNARIRQMLRK